MFDGLKVGQHATEPAMIDKVHAATLGFFLNNSLSLTLGADKKDRTTVGNDVSKCCISLAKQFHGDIKVYNVNPISWPVDIGFHFGIPAAGLVTEVQTSFQHLTHIYSCHVIS